MQRNAIWDYLSRRPDLPTYVGGWLASMAWLSVVGSTVGDGPFNILIGAITTIGFCLSFWLRGYVGTPQWPIIRRSLLGPSVVIRLTFMLFCVLPGLKGRPPFTGLVPDIAFGTDEWLIGTGFMWAMALYSFGLVSDGLVAFGSVMGLAMLGLMASINVNPEVGLAFMIFLLGNILLLGNMTLAQHASWRRRGDRSTLIRWLVDQTIVAALTVAATSIAAILLAWVLQMVSPKGLVPLVNLPAGMIKGGSFTSGFASFSDNMQIGVGTPFDPESPVVFEANSAEPRLWRRLVYDSFTGRVWRHFRVQEHTLDFLSPHPGVLGDDNLQWTRKLKAVETYTTEVTYRLNSQLAAPPRVVRLTMTGGDQELTQVKSDDYGNVMTDLERGTSLRLVTIASNPTPEQLASAPRVNPVDWREYLKVPSSALPSVGAASRTIAAKVGDNPYAVAKGIQDWLERDFVYDLTYRAPDHGDAVEQYLADKRGACDMIATAMVLMARYNDIPARIAVGFGPGEPSGPDHWTIYMRDAHAWAELYFPDYGWIPFNPVVLAPVAPTVEQPYTLAIGGVQVDLRSTSSYVIDLMVLWLAYYALNHWLRTRRKAWRPVRSAADDQGGLLGWLRRLLRRSASPETCANAVFGSYLDALKALQRAGCGRGRTETARAYVARLSHQLPGLEWLAPLERLSLCYEQVRYLERAAGQAEASLAEQAVREIRRGLRHSRRGAGRGSGPRG